MAEPAIDFLARAASELQRLSREADAGGYPMLAHLIDMAVLEARERQKAGQ